MWLLATSATNISLESVVFPTKPYLSISKRSFGHGKEFSQVGKMAFLQVFCHTCLMGFKLKRVKTSMRADPAFVSSIAS